MSAPTPLTPPDGFSIYESDTHEPLVHNGVWLTDNDGDTNSVMIANFHTGEMFLMEGKFSKSQAELVAGCFDAILWCQVG